MGNRMRNSPGRRVLTPHTHTNTHSHTKQKMGKNRSHKWFAKVEPAHGTRKLHRRLTKFSSICSMMKLNHECKMRKWTKIMIYECKRARSAQTTRRFVRMRARICELVYVFRALWRYVCIIFLMFQNFKVGNHFWFFHCGNFMYILYIILSTYLQTRGIILALKQFKH